MNNTVFEAIVSTFPFHQLYLTSPIQVPGKQHFCKLTANKQPLFVQSPKCKTKQGIVKSGKKQYCDLVFTNFDEELIEWIETLEINLRKILYSNREKCFDIELTEDDIESYFNPTIKLFKSGKLYQLRATLNPNVHIYDETENVVDAAAINDTTEIITILEFTGVTCSSKSFQLDVEIKQIMIIKPVAEVFNKCIIKTNVTQPLGKPDEKPDSNKLLVETPNVETPNVETPNKEILDNETPDDKEPLSDKPLSNKTLSNEPLSNKPLSNETSDLMQEYIFEDNVLANSDTMHLKEKTEVYYELYREARRKAKLAKSLALSSFLEAKRIKNLYMLDDIDSDESDMDDMDDLDDYQTLD